MLNPATRRFDAEWTLSELLAAAPRAVLQEALAALGGASLLETDGEAAVVVRAHQSRTGSGDAWCLRRRARRARLGPRLVVAASIVAIAR